MSNSLIVHEPERSDLSTIRHRHHWWGFGWYCGETICRHCGNKVFATWPAVADPGPFECSYCGLFESWVIKYDHSE